MKTNTDRRFGWVDLIILLLVAILVFAGVWYWKGRSLRDREQQSIRYTLSVPLEDAVLVGEVEKDTTFVGSTVMNQNGTAELGQVLSVRMRPIVQAVVLNGAVEFVSVPNRVELLVEIRALASAKQGDGYRINEIRLAAGKRGDFRIGGLFAAGATVISVETEEA